MGKYMVKHFAPLNYPAINLIEGSYVPSAIKKYNNEAFCFWERALFQRALSVLQIELPEDWCGTVKDFFYYVLFKRGYMCVFNYEESKSTIFQDCTFGAGFDIYYQPISCIVTNPHFNSKELNIGEDCEILKLTPDFMGIWDIISYYAEKLALLDCSINTSIINTKLAYIVAAKNKAAAETLKKIYDGINSGNGLEVFDKMVLEDDANSKSEPWQFLERKGLKESYITDKLLMDFNTIMHGFDTEIGIPTLPIEKKERMISDEANMRSIDATSRSKIWVDTFNDSAKAVNEHFGLNIKASLNFDIERMDSDGEDDVNRNV